MRTTRYLLGGALALALALSGALAFASESPKASKAATPWQTVALPTLVATRP